MGSRQRPSPRACNGSAQLRHALPSGDGAYEVAFWKKIYEDHLQRNLEGARLWARARTARTHVLRRSSEKGKNESARISTLGPFSADSRLLRGDRVSGNVEDPAFRLYEK